MEKRILKIVLSRKDYSLDTINDILDGERDADRICTDLLYDLFLDLDHQFEEKIVYELLDKCDVKTDMAEPMFMALYGYHTDLCSVKYKINRAIKCCHLDKPVEDIFISSYNKYRDEHLYNYIDKIFEKGFVPTDRSVRMAIHAGDKYLIDKISSSKYVPNTSILLFSYYCCNYYAFNIFRKGVDEYHQFQLDYIYHINKSLMKHYGFLFPKYKMGEYYVDSYEMVPFEIEIVRWSIKENKWEDGETHDNCYDLREYILVFHNN